MGSYLREKFQNGYFWSFVTLVVFLLTLINQTQLKIQNPRLTETSGRSSVIGLPFIKEIPAAEYVISGTINYNPLLNSTMARIIADDGLLSLRLNQQDLPLDQISPSALFDYTNGFHYDFARYLKPGTNQIELRFVNRGGLGGITFRQSERDWRWMAGICLLLAILVAFFNWMLSGLNISKINKGFILIFSSGFAVRLLYFLITSYGDRSHDIGGHLDYIEYLVNHRALPGIHTGWQTYHPPVYYLIAAFVYWLLKTCGANHEIIWRSIQFMSLVFFMGVLGVAIPIVKNLVGKLPVASENHSADAGAEHGELLAGEPRLWVAYLGYTLMVFWPSGIIHSLRIGNDLLFYLFFTLGLWYLIKWHDNDTDRDAYLSFLFTTLGFTTKANGAMLYLVFAVIFVLKFIKSDAKRTFLGKAEVLLIIFLCGFGITFGRMVQAKLQGSTDNFVVANSSQLKWVDVGNTPKNYLTFDLPGFVTETYVNPFADKGGRQFFWNYLCKTGLVGEFTYPSALNIKLTNLLSILFLLMLGYVSISLILLRKYLRDHLVLAVTTLVLLIGAIAMRVSVPASCSNDFRYILPIIIPFGCFYAYCTWFHRQRQQRWLEMTAYGLAGAFSLTSIAFFVALALKPM